MRQPKRHRTKPRKLSPPPEGVDLAAVAERVRYVGSPEHKETPSFAGTQPRPRPDATICDPSFENRQADITLWLQEAVRKGCVGGPWKNGFPRYAWHKEGEVVFEAELTNSGVGSYKGYELSADEWPKGIA